MNEISEVIKMAEGNPGALKCLIAINSSLNSNSILTLIKEYGIVGTDIYILWSDICNNNLDLMCYILNNSPKESIIEAVSKQDYSGRQILSKWIEEFNS